jgi:hypothetical protein
MLATIKVMRKSRLAVFLSCSFLSLSILVWGQMRKAGLWELTTTQTWQQSPLPPGMNIPNSPFAGGTRTTQVCLTQQQIDKYGGAIPSTRDCQVTNVNKTASGMTADLVCTGKMGGKGTVESSWTDAEHTKTKIHFTGAIQMGPNSKPLEWTIASSGVFKGADCGSVKPVPTPDK